ncbi:hypothetical protein KIN20_038243 [Parelaphostrongylus tenuis]|uniref:Riboflavin transporter n=1 Tax=Parelaphostrongylus tenuis TaxID=148309 RepID=A0AAD5WLM6_PARTN|nr:hypothetical protein KIN20_038243 [Parelaphostrongylus tenuis]
MLSKNISILAVIFGSVSWLGSSAVLMELPLLTADLPEGWTLPSFVAAIVKLASVGSCRVQHSSQGMQYRRCPHEASHKCTFTAFLYMSTRSGIYVVADNFDQE